MTVFTLGALSFAAPWALAGLAALPAIWWLLRLQPPEPKEIVFPPIRLIRKITGAEQSPAGIPPWLLALRIALVLAVIFGAARPVFNAGEKLPGGGPLVLVIDDGWAAAANWRGRQFALRRLIGRAERQGRGVVMVSTAVPPYAARAEAISVLRPAEAMKKADALTPKPWLTDRAKALAALSANKSLMRTLTGGPPSPVFWLSDGLKERGDKGKAFIDELKALGPVTVITDPPGNLARLLEPPVNEGQKLKLIVRRAWPRGDSEVWLRALGAGGRLLARRAVRFRDGDRRAEAAFALPPELRNQLERIEIENETTAAAAVLIDERWRRRPVGLVSAAGATPDQPLLRETYYLARAFEPFAELGRGRMAELLKRNFSVLVLTDGGKVGGGKVGEGVPGRLEDWLKGGGVLVRFAGPNLARRALKGDTFLPVRLRGGGRAMGGALSWVKPAALAPFAKESPFRGLAIPGDIAIRRQVLAQPSLDLAAKTWARLDDGTPLVTAERRGAGWLVLFHTTANASWSNLALSGLFVEMLKRIVDLSQGVNAAAGAAPLKPIETLDGFGRPGSPPPGALAILPGRFAATRVGPGHPPGLYGGKSERRALNLSAALGSPRVLAPLPPGVAGAAYGKSAEMDLRPWAFGLALVLALVDLMASLGLRGLLRLAGTGVLALVVLGAGETKAQTNEDFARAAATKARLAYVVTGNGEVDRISRAGLAGLTLYVNRRTAAELGKPLGVDLEKDELSFFPLLYWPVIEDQGPLSATARMRVSAYFSGGGTVLFDTRGGGASLAAVSRLSRSLDLPALAPMPADHVLTKSFYLLKEFPGRWAGNELWVEQAGRRVNDGVATVIAGSNDWAAAWAMDEGERPLFQAVPGGARQREAAFRFGINLVMYTLTGNYKSDQVHAPFILKRLGQ